MCDFLHVNASLWDIKKTEYRRVDKKAKLWEDQGNAMGKSVQHLQGWFKSLRDLLLYYPPCSAKPVVEDPLVIRQTLEAVWLHHG